MCANLRIGWIHIRWIVLLRVRELRASYQDTYAQVIGLNKMKSIRIIIWPILICLQLRRPISIESIVTTFVWMHARHIQTNRRNLIRFRLQFQWHAYPDIIYILILCCSVCIVWMDSARWWNRTMSKTNLSVDWTLLLLSLHNATLLGVHVYCRSLPHLRLHRSWKQSTNNLHIKTMNDVATVPSTTSNSQQQYTQQWYTASTLCVR